MEISNMLEIQTTLEDGRLTVVLSGELNTTTSPKLETAIENDLENINDIVFDMTDLSYITSAGLRILLFSQQELEDRGSVIVRGASPVIREVIEVTGFDSILTLE